MGVRTCGAVGWRLRKLRGATSGATPQVWCSGSRRPRKFGIRAAGDPASRALRQAERVLSRLAILYTKTLQQAGKNTLYFCRKSCTYLAENSLFPQVVSRVILST